MLKRFLSIICFALPAIVLAQDSSAPFSAVGVAVKASLLGAGAEAATPLTHHLNLRGGFNALSYDRGFDKDGVTYTGQLRLRSAEAHLDWFPFHHGFHVGPGVLLYNGNQFHANAAVPGGNTFTLNGTSYMSDPTDPVTGLGSVNFKKAGPMLTAGWGNLVKRHGHISVPFEIGAIYTGAPRAALALAGSVCDPTGEVCQPIASDPDVLANVTAEQTKINKDVSAFKFYPIVSIGFGVKF